jgi:2-polyprenyl-6-hydroxyphenyl methylase/3-demethylubiquinone-9 3-methyltransferase
MGSVLDGDKMRALGAFDVVYRGRVAPHGPHVGGARTRDHSGRAGRKLVIAIYNDLGTRSRRWRWIRRPITNCRSWRVPFAIAVTIRRSSNRLGAAPGFVQATICDPGPSDGRRRGMSRWHDILDWVGATRRVCDAR